MSTELLCGQPRAPCGLGSVKRSYRGKLCLWRSRRLGFGWEEGLKFSMKVHSSCSTGTFVSNQDKKQFKRTVPNCNDNKDLKLFSKAKAVSASPLSALLSLPWACRVPSALPRGNGSAPRGEAQHRPQRRGGARAYGSPAGCGHGLCSVPGTEGR